MAKKKVEEIEKPDFSDKTVADVYEGLIVLDTKLNTLITLFEKVVNYTEKKEKGELGIN